MPTDVVHDVASTNAKLSAIRASSAYGALAKAAEISAKHPVFARMPFGVWCGILIGQANRGEVIFVRRDKRVVGMAGWMRLSRDAAERWLQTGEEAPPDADGDAVIVNIVQADDREALSYIVGLIPEYLPGARSFYARRFYKDGRSRPVRLSTERAMQMLTEWS